MPLVRYEVRCEHTLANPELFRSAGRDDPEGLLEGVAVAGLIGIVRQLGDLAEFAAEVFRDLHKELTAVGGRAHDLTVRVQQLETELPSVEKTLLSEPNQLRFAYTNGADWHASIRSDQKHCTSGELPRFVRNFYEECRGPPRLFLLDKFDAAGSGACLKRYTDPSFFKLEWASSELLKAQRAQRDKKARREKKKGRRRKTGQAVAAINQIPARVRYGSATLDDLDSLSHLLASTLKDEAASSSSKQGPGTQTQRRSKFILKGKTNGGSLPPPGPSAAQGGGGEASKALKISAKDIEANVSGKFYQPSQPEGVAESMAGKISKIIEMEDRTAVPGIGLVPRNVEQRETNGSKIPPIDVESKRVTKEELEAAAMARTGRTSRGSSRSNALMDGREPQGSRPGKSRSSQSSIPDVTSSGAGDSTGHPGLQTNSSRTGSVDVQNATQFAADVSRRSVNANLDVHVSAGGVPRQNLGGYNRDGDNAGSTSPDGVSVDESVKEQIDGSGEAEDRYGASQRRQDSAHSRKPSQQHAKNQRQSTDPGTQPLSIHDSPARESEVTGGVDEEQRQSLAVAGAVERGLLSNGYFSEDSPLSGSGRESGFYDGHALKVANNGRNTRAASGSVVDTGYQQPDLPPVRVEEVLVDEEGSHTLSVLRPMVLSQCSSPVEDLRPSASMLSRLSYSSELVSVSSGSVPDSPVSPKSSPAFNALYSTPGLPRRTSGDISESPHGIFTGSYSRSGHYSGLSSPRSEVLVLSSSPKSPPASSSPVAWESDTGPVRPPPPLPIGNGVPSHLESGRMGTSATYESCSLASASPRLSRDVSTSSELDGMASEAKGGFSGSHFEEDVERIHAEPSIGGGNNLDFVRDPTSSRDVGADFEARYSDAGGIEPSVGFLQVEEQSEVRELSTLSPFGLPDSGTETSQKRFNHSDRESIPELRRVDIPSDGPTSDIDPPVEEPEAGSFGEDRRDPSSIVAFTDFVRSSLIPPLRPSESPSSSAHTSPLGSPKQRLQRILLTNPSVQPTPSPLGQATINGYADFPVEDEESVPSSPTGSVIIKDTPSPPGSPASNYSESESEIHEFEHPDDELKNQAVSSRSVALTVKADVVDGKTSSDETNVQEDPALKLSQSDLTGAMCVRSNSASKEVDHGLSGEAVETPTFDSPVHREISNEETLLHDKPAMTNPPTSPHADFVRTSPVHSPGAGILKPVLSRPGPKSRNSSASNSPPESPPRKEYLGGDDGGLRAELRGRSPSKSWIGLEPESPGRSPSNSPPTSPPRFSPQAGSLRWRRRYDRGSEKPDFSLPPNLVCLSETSSPPCSPPPQSNSESPKQWDEGSEVSSSSDSSDSSVSTHRHENGNEVVYRLPDAPLPLDSSTMSEAGDRSSGSSSRSESDAEDVKAGEHEDGMVQFSSSADPSKLASPRSLADKPENEVILSGGRSTNDGNEPSEVPLRSSSFDSSVKPEMSNSPSQEICIQQPASENETYVVSKPNEFELHPAPPAPGLADTPASKDVLAFAIAHHDWNVMKALTVKDPGHRPVPPPDERSILLEQIRSDSFSLHRAGDSLGEHGHVTRPSANINVAAILEKANAIRQAFVGSDDEDGDEDDWSDS